MGSPSEPEQNTHGVGVQETNLSLNMERKRGDVAAAALKGAQVTSSTEDGERYKDLSRPI